MSWILHSLVRLSFRFVENSLSKTGLAVASMHLWTFIFFPWTTKVKSEYCAPSRSCLWFAIIALYWVGTSKKVWIGTSLAVICSDIVISSFSSRKEFSLKHMKGSKQEISSTITFSVVLVTVFVSLLETKKDQAFDLQIFSFVWRWHETLNFGTLILPKLYGTPSSSIDVVFLITIHLQSYNEFSLRFYHIRSNKFTT